ncbi:P1 family peptidase [Streptomyces sp. NPDC057580]|uniref:P1 family peptidase n=1 Tax=Streptomyces sp. NPDC057580 TaxID=3346173 RepID=UPI0036838752
MIKGLRVGHWTDRNAGTGLTVFVVPEQATVAAAPRGQNPGTLNLATYDQYGCSDTADAIVLTGGSCYGLTAASYLQNALAERQHGVTVPGVVSAVVFDLEVGRIAWPELHAAHRAYEAAVPAGDEEVGTVGAGTGVTAGSIDGPGGSTKGGFGRASRRTAQGPTVAAWAVVNPIGDVIGEDGQVLAGLRRDGRFFRVTEAFATDERPEQEWGKATTLVVVATDARLTKREAWRLAHAGHGGIAHAVSPCATGLDGDTAFAVATGEVEVQNMLALEGVAAAVTAEAIRDAVRQATGLHGVPALRELDQADDARV